MKQRRLAFNALLSIVAGSLAVGLSAQSPAAPSGTPDFNGTWTGRRCIPANSDVCPDVMSDKSLTARAKAFRDSFDELAIPKYDCFPATVPALLTDPYPFLIEQKADRVTITYEKDDVVRTVWLNGQGPKPQINEFWPNGYSTGRYEGNELVIETSKFVFDPTGIDDDYGPMPSSTKKRLIERYSRAADRIRVDLTIEDPVFLLEPIKYVVEWQKSAQPPALPWNCDPVAASENLKYNPTKYPDPKK